MRVAFLLAALVAAPFPASAAMAVDDHGPSQARQAADSLMAADRAFAQAAQGKSLVEGITAMFDAETVMPVPGGFVKGREAIAAALAANPLNVGAQASWTPVRAGVSADGQHGFTIGYMTITAEGKPNRNAKYVAYWIRRADGWRPAVYKRNGRPDGDVSLDVMAPSLPESVLQAATDKATLTAYRDSLDKAERAFSDDAQVMGIGPAFVKYGRADATNIGAGPAFTVGNENIGKDVASFGGPPPSWAPDGGVIVAATGDFGITWGLIRPKPPLAEGQPATIPYTTVWRRAAPDQPWRYVAE